VIGGWLFVHLSWQAVFWFLTIVGVLLWLINIKFLPESLPPQKRQPFQFRPLMQGYGILLTDPRFLLLALASGIPFNGMFLYLLSAPAFLGDICSSSPRSSSGSSSPPSAASWPAAGPAAAWPDASRPSARSGTAFW
jgi:DHA1 family bicyclomycin/chloramphenicol resistance-like MFS transporter